MAKRSEYEQTSVETNSICYRKDLSWAIEKFEDWWSSRRIASSEQDRRVSTHSPAMCLIIDGMYHEFEVAILKYDSYDRYDDDHNLMMGISIFYKGPSESVIIKPSFYIKGNEDNIPFGNERNLLKAKELRKDCYSDCRIFSECSLMDNKNILLTEGRLAIQCILEIVTFKDVSDIVQLETKIRSRKTWDQYLPEYLDISCTESKLDAFSDFEIICLEENENGGSKEKRFRCHKIVLFLGTNYYKKMFSGNFLESEGSTKVTDISSKTMTTFLQFLYSGEVKKSDIDIDLLLASDKYEVCHLQSICELELARKITIETASELAVASFACGSEGFKVLVYAFVRKHWKQIGACNQSEFIRKDPRLLCDIWDKS